ncbi:MAG: tyrosine-type recombinase/integrase, partial [Actinomycetota bacterium]
HSHAAMLIEAGVHPKVIQKRLGHASIKTTLDTYGHVFDGLDQSAADAINAVWNKSLRRPTADQTEFSDHIGG